MVEAGGLVRERCEHDVAHGMFLDQRWLDTLAHQLDAIHATKLWRWSVRPRRVYALIRRMPGMPPP